MVKMAMLGTSLVIAAAEPALDLDFGKYAITQGGLLIVVLILIYLQRRDNERISKKDDEKIAVLTDLVQANTAALTRSTDAALAMEKSHHRLSRAVEKLDAAR